MKLVIADLDGTITSSNINNTFDFIYHYLVYRYELLGRLKWTIVSILSKIIRVIVKSDVIFRRIIISLLLSFEPIDKLKYFSYIWARTVLQNLNIHILKFIKHYKKKKRSKVIMATACVDPPASLIAKMLSFDICISTKLKVRHGRVLGIDPHEDTYAHLKFAVLARKIGVRTLQEAIYIADETSIKLEKANRFCNTLLADRLNARAYNSINS